VAHQRVNVIFVSALDAHDPEIIKAAQHLERAQVAVIGPDGKPMVWPDGKPQPLKVIMTPPGQSVPDTKQVLVVAQQHMQDAATYRALETLTERQPNLVLRSSEEKPTMSAEYAALRGFGDEEIRAQLMPWIAEARAASQKAVTDAQKALEAAQADLAAAFAPQPGPDNKIELDKAPEQQTT